MNLRLDEVIIYDDYTDDPDAENSILHATEATPVYSYRTPEGEVVLTTVPTDSSTLYGHLHTYEEADPEDEDRLIVVRK